MSVFSGKKCKLANSRVFLLKLSLQLLRSLKRQMEVKAMLKHVYRVRNTFQSTTFKADLNSFMSELICSQSNVKTRISCQKYASINNF